MELQLHRGIEYRGSRHCDHEHRNVTLPFAKPKEDEGQHDKAWQRIVTDPAVNNRRIAVSAGDERAWIRSLALGIETRGVAAPVASYGLRPEPDVAMGFG